MSTHAPNGSSDEAGASQQQVYQLQQNLIRAETRHQLKLSRIETKYQEKLSRAETELSRTESDGRAAARAAEERIEALESEIDALNYTNERQTREIADSAASHVSEITILKADLHKTAEQLELVQNEHDGLRDYFEMVMERVAHLSDVPARDLSNALESIQNLHSALYIEGEEGTDSIEREEVESSAQAGKRAASFSSKSESNVDQQDLQLAQQLPPQSSLQKNSSFSRRSANRNLSRVSPSRAESEQNITKSIDVQQLETEPVEKITNSGKEETGSGSSPPRNLKSNSSNVDIPTGKLPSTHSLQAWKS